MTRSTANAVAALSAIFAISFLATGCTSSDDGPSVCDAGQRVPVIQARLDPQEPSEPFEIDDTGSVFVAVTNDPAYNLAAISRSVGALYLIADGAAPDLAPDPNFDDVLMSLDESIRFDDLGEYRFVDAEPGFYRVYSNRRTLTIDLVRCP